MPLALLVLDQDCTFFRVNTLAERLTGYYRSKLIGQRCDHVLKPRPCGATCLVHKILQARTTHLLGTMEILTADGKSLAAQAAVSPLAGPRGRIIGAVLLLSEQPPEQEGEQQTILPLRARKEVQERAAILEAINAAGGNLTRAARELGVHRTTLWRKLRSLGIQR